MKRILFYIVLLLAVLVACLYRTDLNLPDLKNRYMTPDSRFTLLDGMNVHYRVEGNPSDSVPILLIHGTGAMLQTWDGWAAALKAERRVIRLDLPGYGITGPHPTNEASANYYADFITRFMDIMGYIRFDVAGNSLGGTIAWHVALSSPQRVRQLVLIDAAGYPFTPKSVPLGFQLARIPLISGFVAKLTPDILFRKSLENVYYNDSLVTDKLVETYADLNRREGNRQNFVRRRPTLDSLYKRIPEIKHPTLILWGAHDELIPVEVANRFHRDLPNDTLIVYPNAGHVPMEELPSPTAYHYRMWAYRVSGKR
jgi:pimeloyl-ACP methyl ester carboxylesterase